MRNWKRKSGRKWLFFCSLECNVRNLESNAKSPDPERRAAQEKELAEAHLQLEQVNGFRKPKEAPCSPPMTE
jgi:hypothetical protein